MLSMFNAMGLLPWCLLTAYQLVSRNIRHSQNSLLSSLLMFLCAAYTFCLPSVLTWQRNVQHHLLLAHD